MDVMNLILHLINFGQIIHSLKRELIKKLLQKLFIKILDLNIISRLLLISIKQMELQINLQLLMLYDMMLREIYGFLQVCITMLLLKIGNHIIQQNGSHMLRKELVIILKKVAWILMYLSTLLVELKCRLFIQQQKLKVL